MKIYSICLIFDLVVVCMIVGVYPSMKTALAVSQYTNWPTRILYMSMNVRTYKDDNNNIDCRYMIDINLTMAKNQVIHIAIIVTLHLHFKSLSFQKINTYLKENDLNT